MSEADDIEAMARAIYCAEADSDDLELGSEPWCERLAQAAYSVVRERMRVMEGALEKQGLALAAWVNLVEPVKITVNDCDIFTGDSIWARDPTHEEVQAALGAQNDARAALTRRMRDDTTTD